MALPAAAPRGPDQERVRPGILGEFHPLPTIEVAGERRVGEDLTVTVLTRGGCFQEYTVTGPQETVAIVEGAEVAVRPLDLWRRQPPRTACLGEIFPIQHEVTIVPANPGSMTIRAVGRGLGDGSEAAILEISITVEP